MPITRARSLTAGDRWWLDWNLLCWIQTGGTRTNSQFLIRTQTTGAEINAGASWCACVVSEPAQTPWLCPLSGARSISTSAAIRTPVPRPWSLNIIFQEKECGLPREMSKSRTGAGKIQDKLGLHCGARKEERATQRLDTSERQEPTSGGPKSQSWSCRTK